MKFFHPQFKIYYSCWRYEQELNLGPLDFKSNAVTNWSLSQVEGNPTVWNWEYHGAISGHPIFVIPTSHLYQGELSLYNLVHWVSLQSWPIFSGSDTKIAFAVYICVLDINNQSLQGLVVRSLRISGSPPPPPPSLPQAMWIATEIIRTVHKHSNTALGRGGGGGGEVFRGPGL